MPNCIKCQCHYRLDEYNNSLECFSCLDTNPEEDLYLDEDDQVDVDMLTNPTGVTKAVFYE
jgi:hypothetical protein